MTAGVFAATLLVTTTTIDDALWLIPYCTSPQLPYSTKIVHGATFVLTLETLTLICILISNICQKLLRKRYENTNDNLDLSFVMGMAGSIFCWIIAIGLYFKKIMKRRRKSMAAMVKARESSESNSLINRNEEIPPEIGVNEKNSDDNEYESVDADLPTAPSVWMVVSLTTLGALDEISYFPALLVGNVFSPLELCLGTFFASSVILIIVLLFLSKFKPLVDFLDTIPLYGIVGMFALILTVGLFI